MSVAMAAENEGAKILRIEGVRSDETIVGGGKREGQGIGDEQA
jgi:hypothetical protein